VLRLLREARGLSLREAARRADVDPSHLWRVEAGQHAPSLRLAVRLAALYGVALDDLVAPYVIEGAKPGRKEAAS
jgi:transcriptional regulator with XRE-family HTH domain